MSTDKILGVLRKIIDQYSVIADHIVHMDNQTVEVYPSEKGVHYWETHTTTTT
jgi:hypothetical protein